MIELAAFFGNPGKSYSRNRHNAGFMLAGKLSAENSLSWQKKFKGLYAVIDSSRLNGYFTRCDGAEPNAAEHIHLLMPQTFMNLSGESVFAAASFYKIKPENILVIHDELELPPGTVSLKFSGGLGGHNGLRSMKACFGTADFWRIRIGIGRPDNRLPGEGGPPGSGEGIADWVLSNFDEGEAEILEKTMEAALSLLLKCFVCDPQNLLNEWKKKKIDRYP